MKKFIITLCVSFLSGAVFTVGQWFASDLINEGKKRKQIDAWKEEKLAEIRERREAMGLV